MLYIYILYILIYKVLRFICIYIFIYIYIYQIIEVERDNSSFSSKRSFLVLKNSSMFNNHSGDEENLFIDKEIFVLQSKIYLKISRHI